METRATDGDGDDDDDDLEAEITRMMLERRDEDGENAKKRPRVSRAADEGAVEEAEAGPFSTLHDDVVSLILRFLAPNELTSRSRSRVNFSLRAAIKTSYGGSATWRGSGTQSRRKEAA